MKKMTSGILARSLAGHDKGKLYVVTALDGDYVYLADGIIRTNLNPKRKKRIHVQPDYAVSDRIRERQALGLAIRDEDIRDTLREHQLGQMADQQRKSVKTKEV